MKDTSNGTNETSEDSKVPEGYTLASNLFNQVLEKYMTRQLFYSSVVPIFERANKVFRKGRYLYIEASIADWEVYAQYRHTMVESKQWIKRRPWSFEDLGLAVAATTPEPVPA